MELKIGKMSSKEIAAWMNISYNTYRNDKKKYLEKLGYFANFKEIYGGVEITNVIIPTYVKNVSDDVKTYVTQVKSADDYLTTLSGMVEVLKQERRWEDIPDSTLKRRLRTAGNTAFGETAKSESYGFYGTREYVWCVKLYDRPNHYRYLTKEEQQLFDNLTESLYSNSWKKMQLLALLDDAFLNDELTKEEYFYERELMGLYNFEGVIFKFKEQTGLQLVRATRHELDQVHKPSAFPYAAASIENP